MQVEMEIHDIIKGDEPPEDGYYLVFRQDVDGQVGLEPLYWKSDVKAWSVAKSEYEVLEPAKYWGRYWTPNFLNKVVRI